MWTVLHRVSRRTSGLDVFPLAAAKDHLRLAADDTADDTILTECIRRAVDAVEGPDGIGIALMSADWVLSLDRLPRKIALPLGPVADIVSVVWRDAEDVEATLDAGAYRVETGVDPALLLARPGADWPTPYREAGSVLITYTAGYASANEIPGPLMQAIALMVGDFYEHREGTVIGAHSAASLPMGVERLLAPFRRGQFA